MGQHRDKAAACEPSARELCKDRVLWAIVGLAGLLLFWALDGRRLWQDEAETALLGRNILRFGVPIAHDGTNVVSQEAGREFVPDRRFPAFLWRWSPWVQFYLAAGSLGIFGSTTFAARLPFAVLGLATVPATYLLARRLFLSVAVARLSALYLTLSVPFLLHARQARWYSVSYLLIVLLLLSVEAMVRKRRYSAVGFAVSGTLLVHTNYYVAVGVLLALVPAAAVLRAERSFLLRLAKASGAVFVLALPVFAFFGAWEKGTAFDPEKALRQLLLYAGYYFTFLLPLPMLLMLGCALAEREQKAPAGGEGKKTVRFLLLLATVDCFVQAAPRRTRDTLLGLVNQQCGVGPRGRMESRQTRGTAVTGAGRGQRLAGKRP